MNDYPQAPTSHPNEDRVLISFLTFYPKTGLHAPTPNHWVQVICRWHDLVLNTKPDAKRSTPRFILHMQYVISAGAVDLRFMENILHGEHLSMSTQKETGQQLLLFGIAPSI